MRFPLLLTTVAICLLLCLAGAVPVQAQIQSLNERNSFWQTEPAINLPVTLCHIPFGNPDNAHTIEVAQAAVAAHLAHGDTLGECAGECPPYPAMVPKTGQTTSAAIGDDGWYQMGASVETRFTDNADGTVTDNLSGLIWLKDASCLGIQTWHNALSEANTLADGSCGLTDGSAAGAWRLPNFKELQSLVDYGEQYPALPPDQPFSGMLNNVFWSSTITAGTSFRAWCVNVSYGDVLRRLTADNSCAWPVRGPE